MDQPTRAEYTTDAADVIQAEKDHIGKDVSLGLAISGGGIRSASFGLGVLQGLVGSDVLRRVDYLSTVSGGGYIGSSLTWFLKKGFPNGDETGTSAEDFPFGAKGVGARTGERRNQILDFIRQHGNYLTPGKGLNLISLIAAALRSMLVSLAVYLSTLTVVMVALKQFSALGLSSINDIVDIGVATSVELSRPIWLAILLVAVFVVSSLVFSIRTRLTKIGASRRYRLSIFGQRFIGWIWMSVLFLLVVGSVRHVHGLLESAIQGAVAAGGSTVLGAILGFLEFRKRRMPGGDGKGAFAAFLSQARVVIGAAALIYGLLLAAYALADPFSQLWWYVGLIVATLVFGIVVNLNYVGLHRMYRDRLMETFLPSAGAVEVNQWGRAPDADVALLETMCLGKARRPFHLINTNIVLVDSPTTKFRGRGGDSFILSPLFCGSNATGWRRTGDYMKRGGRGMTLATAMAISGAAVNPHTGVAGKGVMRDKLVSALLSLLSLRLGYWAPNPKVDRRLPFPPNFIVPGLTRGVLGRGFSERSRSIELSDGGHFENLGLYELVRRKLPLIIVSDAGADPGFRFGDLENAVERTRVDFGAKIRFRESLGLEGLLPGSEEGFLAEKFNLSERGFAIADIDYHDGSSGVLYYVKSTLTPGLPADVYGYKSANPAFPDQSTADQFFDEEQFEAYRELGYHLAKHMLGSGKCEELIRSSPT